MLQSGVYGESSGSNSGQSMNSGGHFFAANSTGSNVGVYGVASSTSTCVGGFFIAENNPTSSGSSVGAWGRGLKSDLSFTGVRGRSK